MESSAAWLIRASSGSPRSSSATRRPCSRATSSSIESTRSPRRSFARSTRGPGRRREPAARLQLDGAAEMLLARGNGRPARLARARPALDENEHADVRIVFEADSNTQLAHRRRPGPPGAPRARRASRSRNRYSSAPPPGELRWVLTLVPDRGRRAGRRDVACRLRGLRLRRRRSSTDDPVGALAGVRRARSRATADWPRGEARAANRRRGHRPDARRRRAHVGSSARARRTSPTARSSPARSRRASTARSASAIPARLPGARGRGTSSSASQGGEVVDGAAAQGQEFLREMLAMDDGARRLGEFAFGLNDGDRPIHAEHPLRREDRRHRPPRARHVVSGDRRHEPLRPALGHRLRPAHGQRGLRGRRARLSRRRLPARRALSPT